MESVAPNFLRIPQQHVAVDGEVVTQTPIRVSVAREALRSMTRHHSALGTNLGTRQQNSNNIVVYTIASLVFMAERVEFEPTVQFPAHTLSKRAP